MKHVAKQIRERTDAAWQRKRLYEKSLFDIYQYVMPYRETACWQGEAAPRTDLIFDSTAVKAGFRFAGRMLEEFTPAFRTFFSLEPGPIFPEDDEKKQLALELQRIGKIVAGVLANGSFPQRAHEMYYDLFAGTGAMLMMPGDDVDIIRFRTVPILELAIDEGPYGDIWHGWWKRKWKWSEVQTMWPKGEFSQDQRDLMRTKPDDTVEVCQYVYFDPEAKNWPLVVMLSEKSDDAVIWEETFRSCPWLTPRFFVVPGEPYGRGPAHLALPGVKTLNKARELALMAAAFAVMGIWTRRNDGIFNPDTSTFAPMAFWQVSSNGGPLGPTISRLPVPQDFDITSIVMADEREQVKQALFDDLLPGDDVAVRSATEIAGRIQRDARDFGGVSGRLAIEIVVKLVQRTLDILYDRGALGQTSIKIDQLLTQVRVVSPMALSQNADKVKGAVDWMQMQAMMHGPQAVMINSNVEKLWPAIGRWMGVEEEFINSAAQQKQWMALFTQMQQQQAAAQAGPPQVPTPEQYMNGSGGAI